MLFVLLCSMSKCELSGRWMRQDIYTSLLHTSEMHIRLEKWLLSLLFDWLLKGASAVSVKTVLNQTCHKFPYLTRHHTLGEGRNKSLFWSMVAYAPVLKRFGEVKFFDKLLRIIIELPAPLGQSRARKIHLSVLSSELINLSSESYLYSLYIYI